MNTKPPSEPRDGQKRERPSVAMRPLLRVVLLALLLAASLVGAGAAQVRPVRLATRPGNVHLSQSTALLPDGRFAAVWTQGRTVFLQYVDSNGTVAFGAPGRAVATAPVSEVGPGAGAVVVAHARDGVLVAVRRHIGGGRSRILVQWLDGHGNPRWGTGTYAAPVARRENQLEPFLLASSDGGGFVCFVRETVDFRRSRTRYCQRFSPEGQRLWGTEGARGSLSRRWVADEPRAVAAGDGGLLVFWWDWDNSSLEKAFLRGQRLGPDGVRHWGDEGTIVFKNNFACDDDVCDVDNPWISAVSDGAGGAILAFDGRSGRLPEGTGLNRVTAQRISAAGESLWGDGVSVLPSLPPQHLYDLFVHPDGGAVVAVVTFPFVFVDGGLHLVLQRLGPDGRPLWPKEGVTVVDLTSSPDSVYEGPIFGSVDNGVLRIAWERSYTSSPRAEIRFSAFDAAGNRLTPSDGVPLVRSVPVPDKGPLIRGYAFNPASGTSFVAWEGARGAAAVLYAPR